MNACSIPECGRQAVARGWCKRHWQNWNRNGDPAPRIKKNANGQGSVRGAYRVFVRNYVAVGEHVLVAERALGKPLPPGAIVHHVDHDGLNNAPTNLVICPSTAYHMLIHKRERALDACGHADWERCKRCTQYGDPALMKRVNKQFRHYQCPTEESPS